MISYLSPASAYSLRLAVQSALADLAWLRTPSAAPLPARYHPSQRARIAVPSQDQRPVDAPVLRAIECLESLSTWLNHTDQDENENEKDEQIEWWGS